MRDIIFDLRRMLRFGCDKPGGRSLSPERAAQLRKQGIETCKRKTKAGVIREFRRVSGKEAARRKKASELRKKATARRRSAREQEKKKALKGIRPKQKLKVQKKDKPPKQGTFARKLWDEIHKPKEERESVRDLIAQHKKGKKEKKTPTKKEKNARPKKKKEKDTQSADEELNKFSEAATKFMRHKGKKITKSQIDEAKKIIKSFPAYKDTEVKIKTGSRLAGVQKIINDILEIKKEDIPFYGGLKVLEVLDVLRFDGKDNPGWGGLYQEETSTISLSSSDWSAGSELWAREGALNTIIHENGHHVHFALERLSGKRKEIAIEAAMDLLSDKFNFTIKTPLDPQGRTFDMMVPEDVRYIRKKTNAKFITEYSSVNVYEYLAESFRLRSKHGKQGYKKLAGKKAADKLEAYLNAVRPE